ncbi:MAG: hypothetical protein AABY09_05570, partial [Nanoarchaeota archaeon]
MKKIELTKNDRRVIVRTDMENFYWNDRFFPEFPDLTGDEISRSADKLLQLDFLRFSRIKMLREWVLTDKADKYMSEHKDEFKEEIEEYKKNDKEMMEELAEAAKPVELRFQHSDEELRVLDYCRVKGCNEEAASLDLGIELKRIQEIFRKLKLNELI